MYISSIAYSSVAGYRILYLKEYGTLSKEYIWQISVQFDSLVEHNV